MAIVTDNAAAGPAGQDREPASSPQQEPVPEDPGYLVVEGEAAAEDGSVAEILGGLPAVQGSAWDIGAPLEDRGGNPDDERGSRPGASGGVG
jgi:hypothetical protein